MSEQAAEWRALAVEMLAAAAEMTDPEAKAEMLDLAALYQGMADREDPPGPTTVLCGWAPPETSQEARQRAICSPRPFAAALGKEATTG